MQQGILFCSSWFPPIDAISRATRIPHCRSKQIRGLAAIASQITGSSLDIHDSVLEPYHGKSGATLAGSDDFLLVLRRYPAGIPPDLRFLHNIMTI
jgi:hypothetical protein